MIEDTERPGAGWVAHGVRTNARGGRRTSVRTAALPLDDRQRIVRQRRRRRKREYVVWAVVWGVGLAAVLLLLFGQILYFLGRQ
jgi:hypothetical protein